MKQFLLSKFLQFDQSAVDDFQTSIANMMPLFNKPSLASVSKYPTTIWGFKDNGFWNMTTHEAIFFESDGTIHLLSFTKDYQYYSICRDLYYASVFSDSICRLSKPLDFSEESWPGKRDKKIYYSKFRTTGGNYGETVFLRYILNKDPNLMAKWITTYINEMTWLLSALLTYGHPCPGWDLTFRLQSGEETFFCILPGFTKTKEECASELLEELGVFLVTMNLNDDILTYAREQWLPILNT